MEARSRVDWPWLWLCCSSSPLDFFLLLREALNRFTAWWLCIQGLRFSSSALVEGQESKADLPGAHGFLGKVAQTEGTWVLNHWGTQGSGWC